MRKLFVGLALVLALFCAVGALAEAGENLIENGDFSDVSASGYPSKWYRDMWFTDEGISYLAVSDEGVEGSAAEVFNADENDARWAQDVTVRPDTVYRLTGMVRTQSIGDAGAGANLSFKDTFVMAETAGDTGRDWAQLELYGRTAADQTELTVFLRVGGYGNLNSGRAWFDDIELCAVETVPEDAIVYDLTPQTGSGASENLDDSFDFGLEQEPARHTEALLLFACAYVLIVIGFARRANRDPEQGSPRRYRAIFAVLLFAALLVRLFLAYSVRGYNTDINCFGAWSERIFSTGLANFYEEGYFCDYPPGYMLLLWPVALLRSMLGVAYDSQAHVVLLKLLPIVCDLLGAMLVWRFAEKRIGARAAMLLAAFYALNPAVIVDSAAWGQIDSVFTLLIVVCALEAVRGRYWTALPAFALAVLVKPQALLFAPLGLAAVILDAVARMRRERNVRPLLRLLGGTGLALAGLYVVALPFSLKASSAPVLFRPIAWLSDLYGGTLTSYRYVTINALNLYCLAGKNWVQTALAPGWTAVAWALFGVGYAGSIALLGLSRDTKKIFLTGGLLIVWIYTFGPMIHERYVFPALILLALGYAECRDRRILWSLTALSATLFLNEVLVLQGGMTEANYGHLQASEQWLNGFVSLVNIFNALLLSYTAFDVCVRRRIRTMRLTPEPVAAGRLPDPDRPGWKLNLRRVDVLLMAAVTVAYSVLTFVNLGSTTAPQTTWEASAPGETVVFDLGQTRTFRMTYYGNICSTNFTVELSRDGESWTEPYYARYDQGEIFRWLWYVPLDAEMKTAYAGARNQPEGVNLATPEEAYPMQNARYVRISAVSAGLKLSEVGFLDGEGNPYPVLSAVGAGAFPGYESDPKLLIDEQDTVPAYPSYYNSTYFDEIYHARTAYEHLHGLSTYEWTHPPLGKVLMMVGIQIFGMTPFGWRFMGALMGVLMLPMLYLLVKQLLKRTDLSFIAMFLLAVDSMHFTQTRIATIDSYAVFFIMVMYFFMFRYCQMDWRRDGLGRTLVPLGLSGLFMGIAWATKWIGLYASVGLAVLFFWTIGRRIREQIRQKDARFVRNLLITLAFCVVFFVVIPALIYYFSYYWHMQYEGGLTVRRVVDLQKRIFDYHAGLSGDTHYFRSEWYEWPVIAWPMWFYSGTEYVADGMISSISCMGNPAVWWFGLAAMLFVIFRASFSRRIDRNYLFVILGFASQYLPWVLVPRSTFIYHYFASVPFIILATVLLLDRIREKSETGFRVTAGTLMVAALVLFAAFYPLESGTPVSRGYAMLLRWFHWYNF